MTASRAGRCSLLRQFYALPPTSITKSLFGVSKYINQLTEFSNHLEGSEQAVSDETLIVHFTTPLPESYKNIVDIILHHPAQEQTLTKVIATLVEWEYSEESHRSGNKSPQQTRSPAPMSSNTPISSALNTHTKYRSSFRLHYLSFHSYTKPHFNRIREQG